MKKLKLWGVIGGSTLVVIIALIFIGKSMFSGSAEGSVKTGSATVHQETALQKAPELVHIDTSYFTAVLPEGFTVKRNIEMPDTPLSQLQFTANTNGTTDQQVAITIGQMPSGGMTQQGDYIARATDTTNYARTTLEDAPEGAVVFRSATGAPALTVLYPHGSQYVEVSLTTDGASTFEKLQATYSQLQSQWTWKQ